MSPSSSESPSQSPSASGSSSISQSASLSPSSSESSSNSASISPSIPPSIFTREALTGLPGDKDDLATIYTVEEEIKVGTLDNIRVDLAGTGSVYLAHEYKIRGQNSQDAMTVTCNLRSTLAPTSSTIYLQIWNVTDSVWETIDSNSRANAGQDLYLVGRIFENNSDYFDTTYPSYNEVAVRVYQLNTSTNTLSVDLIEICFSTGYSDRDTAPTDTWIDRDTTPTDVWTDRDTDGVC